MSGLVVFLLILAGVLGMVGLMVWKVLKAPIPPAAPPEPETVVETKAAEIEHPIQFEPPHQLGGIPSAARDRQAARSRESGGRSALKTGWNVMELGLAAVTRRADLGTILAVTGLVGIGRKRAYHRPPMNGGDNDLGWKRGATQRKPKAVPTLHVRVLASGSILVESREATLAQLDAHLADLKRRGGKVRYYCEPCDPKPPQAAEVINLLVTQRIQFTS